MEKQVITKKLRRFIRNSAKQMPVVKEKKTIQRTVLGQALMNNGVKEVKGKPINPSKYYCGPVEVENLIDHAKAMEKAYLQNGSVGLFEYIKPHILPEFHVEANIKILQLCKQ